MEIQEKPGTSRDMPGSPRSSSSRTSRHDLDNTVQILETEVCVPMLEDLETSVVLSGGDSVTLKTGLDRSGGIGPTNPTIWTVFNGFIMFSLLLLISGLLLSLATSSVCHGNQTGSQSLYVTVEHDNIFKLPSTDVHAVLCNGTSVMFGRGISNCSLDGVFYMEEDDSLLVVPRHTKPVGPIRVAELTLITWHKGGHIKVISQEGDDKSNTTLTLGETGQHYRSLYYTKLQRTTLFLHAQKTSLISLHKIK